MIHPNDSRSNGASCLLICTAVLSSSPAQPQARATSSTGSEAVMSHTVGSHSTSHCGRLRWRPWLPAPRQTVHFLFHSSCCLPRWLPALCQWQFKLYLFSAQDINRKGIFPPAFQKWMEFSCGALDFSKGWVWFMKRRYCIICCCPVHKYYIHKFFPAK